MPNSPYIPRSSHGDNDFQSCHRFDLRTCTLISQAQIYWLIYECCNHVQGVKTLLVYMPHYIKHLTYTYTNYKMYSLHSQGQATSLDIRTLILNSTKDKKKLNQLNGVTRVTYNKFFNQGHFIARANTKLRQIQFHYSDTRVCTGIKVHIVFKQFATQFLKQSYTSRIGVFMWDNLFFLCP